MEKKTQKRRRIYSEQVKEDEKWLKGKKRTTRRE
jgi:hypothetical protein